MLTNGQHVLGYFFRYPFAALNMLSVQEFGREAGLGIVLSAIRAGCWETTLAELLFLGEQARDACQKYDEALQVFQKDGAKSHDELVTKTFQLWLQFKKENPWAKQVPLEPLLSFFGRANEMALFAGLQTLKCSGLVVLSEDHAISPTEKFFVQLVERCRPCGGFATF